MALLFAGLTRAHFRRLKARYGLCALTQIHHIIPREFRRHPCVQHMHIDDGANLMLMPNRLGKATLATRRPNHEGGHLAYNRFVRAQLDARLGSEGREADVDELIRNLRWRLRHPDADLPWRG